METSFGPAWAALLLAADLAGVKAPAPRPAPVRVAALAVAEIRAAQDSAYAPVPALSGLEARAAFDPAGDLWLKLRSGSWEAARRFADGSTRLTTPLGPLELTISRGTAVLSLSGREARLSSGALMDASYAANRRAVFGPIQYAVFHEDGATVPASVTLMRRAQDGVYWVAYRALGDMGRLHWLLSVNGTMYGMRLDGPELGFYSQPTPPL